MSDGEDRTTMGERYASACDSSDLKMRAGGGDVDVIIAAGLIDDSLATSLYRLTVEYDAQRAPIDEARRWLADRTAFANTLREEARKEMAREDHRPGRYAALMDEADTVQADALRALKTEFLLAQSSMRTFSEARNLVRDFAAELAKRKHAHLQSGQVAHLAYRVLEVFLEPNCPHCDARGFNGGGRHEQTGPMLVCKPCRGTGTRRVDLGRDQAERLFAGALMMALDAQMYEVQRAIGRNRRLVDEAKGMLERAMGMSGR